MEAREFVQQSELEGRVDVAPLAIAMHMQVLVALESIRQSMNEPRIAMEAEDDRLVGREQAVELSFTGSIGMDLRRQELEEIDDIDETYLQVRQTRAQDRRCSESLLGCDVAARRQ